jgi:hypothetical protein
MGSGKPGPPGRVAQKQADSRFPRLAIRRRRLGRGDHGLPLRGPLLAGRRSGPLRQRAMRAGPLRAV